MRVDAPFKMTNRCVEVRRVEVQHLMDKLMLVVSISERPGRNAVVDEGSPDGSKDDSEMIGIHFTSAVSIARCMWIPMHNSVVTSVATCMI